MKSKTKSPKYPTTILFMAAFSLALMPACKRKASSTPEGSSSSSTGRNQNTHPPIDPTEMDPDEGEGAVIVTTPVSGIEMVCIPAGWFEMGCDDGEEDAPRHRISVDAFYMDQIEVSQEVYGELIQGNPSRFKGPDLPMEQMSWVNAALYCNARSRADGLTPCYDEETARCDFDADGYRLPTEAEWEYACRAGTESAYFFGTDGAELAKFAWISENSDERTHSGGQRRPNPWELYDMYGNVAEWCNDVYGASYYEEGPERNPRGPDDGKRYVLRGGSWASSAAACRSHSRAAESPGFQDACFSSDTIGFRCVRKATSSQETPEVSEENPSQ